MLQLISIILGVILLIWGFAAHIVLLVILGIIFLAIGGVWVFVFDGDWDFF